MFLVDSSIYIETIRGGEDPVHVYAAEFEDSTLITCGIIMCEVLRGIRDRQVFNRMEEFFSLLPAVEFDNALWQTACRLAWQLDRQGKVLPLSDILIATAALQSNAIIVSTDKHFFAIPDLKVTRELHPPP